MSIIKTEDLRIVYTSSEGVLNVVIPAPRYLSDYSIEECARQSVPEGTVYRIVHKDLIPTDRRYRDAWTDENDTDTVDINLDKAKDIKINTLREIRNNKLKILDVDYLKALENGDKKIVTDITFLKKQLRDMPSVAYQDLSDVKSIDDIDNYLPEGWEK